MKTLRLSQASVWVLSMVLIMGGLWWSAAFAANYHPSSPAPGTFSLWKKMHPSTFNLSIEAVWEQCNRAEPTEEWLTPKHCSLLAEKLEKKQCKVVYVPDGVRLDRLLGRVNGTKGKSEPWAKQEKQTGRFDRAVLCDLSDGVYSYWFTGQKGRSCNNVAFVYLPPTLASPESATKQALVASPHSAPVPSPVVKKPEAVPVAEKAAVLSPAPVRPPVAPMPMATAVIPAIAIAPEQYMRHTGWVDSNVTYQHVPGVMLGNPVAGQIIVIDNGLQNSGQTKVDW